MELFVKQNPAVWSANENEQDHLRLKPLALAIMHAIPADFSLTSFTDFFTCDPAEIIARQEILSDLRKNPLFYNHLCLQLPKLNRLKKQLYDCGHIQEKLRKKIGYYNILCAYADLVREFLNAFTHCSVLCERFEELKANIAKDLSESNARDVIGEVQKLDTRWMRTRSLFVGVHFKKMKWFDPDKIIIGELSERPLPGDCIFTEKGLTEQSGISFMRKPKSAEQRSKLNRFLLGDFVSRFKKEITAFEKIMDRVSSVESVRRFCALADMLNIALAGIKFEKELAERGYETCTPAITDKSKTFAAAGLYSLGLALNSDEPVVSNDVDISDQYYILTGANHSGKTELLISIAQAQVLFQLGLNVPAKNFVSSPVPAIYTLFSGGEDSEGNLSRMALEAERFSMIESAMKPGALVFLNEPMTSTNPDEGAEVCADMIDKITARGGFGIIVTHLFELFAIAGERCGSIVMQTVEDGDTAKRTYKALKQPPIHLSYAIELAEKKGICDRQDEGRTRFVEQILKITGGKK